MVLLLVRCARVQCRRYSTHTHHLHHRHHHFRFVHFWFRSANLCAFESTLHHNVQLFLTKNWKDWRKLLFCGSQVLPQQKKEEQTQEKSFTACWFSLVHLNVMWYTHMLRFAKHKNDNASTNSEFICTNILFVLHFEWKKNILFIRTSYQLNGLNFTRCALHSGYEWNLFWRRLFELELFPCFVFSFSIWFHSKKHQHRCY